MTHNSFFSTSGPWNLHDELTFIDHLGKWEGANNIKPRLTVGRKLELLRGYRTGLSRRAVWTGLSQTELEAYVEREIERLAALPPTNPV